MATQQNLFPDEPAAAPPPSASTAGGGPAPVWLQRMNITVLVLFCLLTGADLAWVPWSPRFWDANNLLLAHPALYAVLRQGWARGVVSGLGLLDIWIGITEAVYYRDYRP